MSPPDDRARGGPAESGGPRDPAPGIADRALVEAVLRGDEAAIRAFTERLGCVPRFLRSIAGRRGRVLGREECEDLVQDVVMTIWQKLPDFRGEASLATWIFRFCDLIARNRFRHLDRRRGAERSADEDPAVDGTERTIDARDSVRSGLDRLPPEDARILQLKHLDGLTFEEMGTTLGLSPNTVKTRYYRALTAMQRWLAAREGRE